MHAYVVVTIMSASLYNYRSTWYKPAFDWKPLILGLSQGGQQIQGTTESAKSRSHNTGILWNSPTCRKQ